MIRDASPDAKTAVTAAGDGGFDVTLPRNAWIVLAPSANAPLPPLAPVATPVADQNPYPIHYK